jgi:hypothetical protein
MSRSEFKVSLPKYRTKKLHVNLKEDSELSPVFTSDRLNVFNSSSNALINLDRTELLVCCDVLRVQSRELLQF